MFTIDDNIFVSIASFRDTKCIDTLKNLYYTADSPDNIYCGIFTQIDINNSQEHCFDTNFQYNCNIRRMLIDYKEAKGPLWARIRIIQNLYQGEKYFLMIDAHTNFSQGWDTNFKNYISFLKKNGINKPILSTYPSSITDKDNNTSLLLCKIISGNKYPEVVQSVHKESGYFYKSYLIAAGFMFCESEYLKDMNIQKIINLSYIFSGEEYLLAVLAYVNGYDIYTPPKSVIFHQYKTTTDKDEDNTDWYKLANINNKLESESLKNLEKLLTTDVLDNVRKTKDLLHIIFGNNSQLTNTENLCENIEKIKYQ